jgi:hypothetical protein
MFSFLYQRVAGVPVVLKNSRPSSFSSPVGKWGGEGRKRRVGREGEEKKEGGAEIFLFQVDALTSYLLTLEDESKEGQSTICNY